MTRRDTPLDARRILELLAEHDVDYVIIGGLAVQAHGHLRTTQGVDLVPAPKQENLRRLTVALEALGARAPVALPGVGVAVVDTEVGGVDVHLSPPGAPPYEELRRRALGLELFGLELRVAGLDDLIAMKRAAGRAIDRGDVLALTVP